MVTVFISVMHSQIFYCWKGKFYRKRCQRSYNYLKANRQRIIFNMVWRGYKYFFTFFYQSIL